MLKKKTPNYREQYADSRTYKILNKYICACSSIFKYAVVKWANLINLFRIL